MENLHQLELKVYVEQIWLADLIFMAKWPKWYKIFQALDILT